MKISIEAINDASVGWDGNERVSLLDAVQDMAAELPEILAGFNRKSPKDNAPDVIVEVNVYEVESGVDVPSLTIIVESGVEELVGNTAVVGSYDRIWRTFTEWFSNSRYLWPANWSYDHNGHGMSNVDRTFKSWPESN